MKHVTYGDKSLLVGDDEADALMEYARVLADNGRADTVTISAISADGNTVEASFLLSANAVMMTETTNSEVEPPDNEAMVIEIRDRIVAITRPPTAEAGAPWMDAESEVRDSY